MGKYSVYIQFITLIFEKAPEVLGRERIEYFGALVESADSPPPFVETERRVDALGAEIDGLRRGADEAFQSPPVEWIDERLTQLRELLQRTTGRSALSMRADAPGTSESRTASPEARTIPWLSSTSSTVCDGPAGLRQLFQRRRWR